MTKTICWIPPTKKNRSRTKSVVQLMNKGLHGKTVENLRNRIDVKFVSNKKDSLKYTSKTKLYATENIWLWLSHHTYKKIYFHP